MYIYHKWVAKNGSHKLTAHIRSGICTYRVKKIEATFHRITISYSLFLNNWKLYFDLIVYGLVYQSQLMCICNHLHVDLSLMSFRFVTIFMWTCCQLHVYLSLVSFRFVMIFLWICYNLCVYLSLVSFRFVTIFILIWEKMLMKKIQICHNIHLLKSAHEYKLV